MSQSASETSSVSSNETLETVEFESILALLRDAAVDAKKHDDFLSFSTILDIHLSEPSKYSIDERERLLQQLLETLSGDADLVYEIGWDIPSLVIPFVDTSFDFKQGLRNAPCIARIFKILDILVYDGNPKELFLKATELLSTTKVSDSADNLDIALKFYDIKLHCIFELINGCYRRIQTSYPSRFLSMIVSSFTNALYLNPRSNCLHLEFVMKRIYTLARNYYPPSPPAETDISSSEAKEIAEDEDYLQRKLLTAFVSYSVSLLLSKQSFGFSVAYLESLQSPNSVIGPESFSLNVPVMERYYSLLTSFDVEHEEIFSSFAKTSVDLVYVDVKDSDKFSEELFERLVIDYQATFASSILNHDLRQIQNSLAGIMLIYTSEVSRYGLDPTFASKFSLSLKEAMAMTLRIAIPGLVHPSLCHLGLHDVAVFWCWFALQRLSKDTRAVELELSSVPSIILQTFLSALLFVIVSSPANTQMRYATLTLLTRFLSSVPEDAAYRFLLNSLKDCPYENAKTALAGTLKALLVNDRKVKDLSEDLESLDVSQKNQPPLPKRDTQKSAKFINLNQERIADLSELIYSCIEQTFIEAEGQPSVNLLKIPTLSSYLNLLVSMKHYGIISTEQYAEIISVTEKNIGSVEKVSKGDNSKANILNAVTILSIALSRLRD